VPSGAECQLFRAQYNGYRAMWIANALTGSEGFFPGVARKLSQGWDKIGEISFYLLETKKTTIFC